MQFDPTEEQEELVGMLRDLLSSRSDSAAVHRAMESESGYNADLWRVLCEEIGAASLAIPEEFGGAGFTAFETHLVLEELGAAMTPSPYLGTVAIAAHAVLASGDTDACERLLPGIAAGETTAALVWADARGRFDASRLGVSFDGAALSGTAPLVIDGSTADVLLVLAETPDGVGLFEVAGDATGVTRVATPAMDTTLRFAQLTFDSAAAVRIGTAVDTDRIRDIAATAVTALQIGGARRILDLTVEYSKQRVQFGRQIGSFQALKHRMADMHLLVETATTASRAAASAVADGSDLTFVAALAKTWASDAFSTVSGEAVQLHGGIAITWEHDAHLYFKRAHATRELFGSPETIRAREAERLLA
ncbi:acyl-CoA dehydrogenase family protein [Microbacterium sp. YY-03]|uniref:acyl-CoA dehydrogenase family protein n=1 Tax=Microbacterium sp. YY-03 TaxID=3421636 RepID=UPI003D178A7C